MITAPKPRGGQLDETAHPAYDSRSMVRGITFFCLVSCLVGCQTTDEGFIVLDPQEFTRVTLGTGIGGDSVPTGMTNDTQSIQGMAVNASAAEDPKAQVIAAGNKLTIFVDEDASLNQQYVVPNDGAIEFPPLGRLQVSGLRVGELETKIKKSLERDYFQKATVSVTLEKAAGGGGVIYVIGAENRGGAMAVPQDEKFTTTKAMLAWGGGGNPFSDLSKVQIIRYGSDGKKYKTVVNVERIMQLGEFEKDIPLVSGDWVIVPEKIFNW